MAIDISYGNPISFTDIKNEFGSPTNNQFGNYRVIQPLVQNGVTFRQFTLDGQAPGSAGSIPTSGPIKFSDFYGKRLTHIVNIFSPANEVEENFINAKNIFDTQAGSRVIVIGPKDSSQRRLGGGGSKVIIVVNKKIGSEKGDGTKCALRTGVWDASCNLEVILDNNTQIYGSGGDGGVGMDGLTTPTDPLTGASVLNGSAGTSGLGIEFGSASNPTKVTMVGAALISAGFGGGGGGGGGYEGSKNHREAGGGGGGGGAGIPAGNAGRGGIPQTGVDTDIAGGAAGHGGEQDTGGAGGAGGNNRNEANGAAGGFGGQFGNRPDGSAGNATAGGDSEAEGGSAGASGYAIRKGTNPGISFTIVGNNANNVRGTVDSGAAGVAGSGVFQGT